MADFGCLGTDISFNVLSRMHTKDLLGLKCASKEWQRLISDHSFIHAQSRKKEPLSGFFLQQRFLYCPDDMETITYIPVERKGLQQDVFSFLPQDVVVLASCNGLVCCRSCYPFEDPAIYVCNPLKSEWRKLNWKNPDKETSIALAFDPLRDFSVTSTDFKVVKARKFVSEQCFSFEIYNSVTNNWTLSDERCWCNNSLSKNGGIYVGGVLYWLTDGNQVLKFNVENELSFLVSTPLPAEEFDNSPQAACIGESEGQLCYVMISVQGLHVWFLKDYVESIWSVKYTKTLGQMESEHPGIMVNLYNKVMNPHVLYMDPFAFKDGVLAIRISDTIYLYHVETSKMEEVGDSSKFRAMFCVAPIVLPYTMTLVPLGHQLGPP